MIVRRINIISRKCDHNQLDDYFVMKCSSGDQLIETLGNVTPSVILLDIEMPGDDGFTICDKIRTQMTHIDCPIVFVTSKKGKDDINSAKAVGGDYFLAKPFTEESLMFGIRRAYQTRRSARF